MTLPFTARLPDDFGHKSEITLKAKALSPDAWFSLTLLSGNQILMDKYTEPEHLGLFQLQLRLDENLLIMNSIGPGANCDEVRTEWNGHHRSEDMNIRIKVTEKKYKIFLNEAEAAIYEHRHESSEAKYLNIYGGFQVEKLSCTK